MSTLFGEISANQVRAVYGFFHVCLMGQSMFTLQTSTDARLVAGSAVHVYIDWST